MQVIELGVREFLNLALKSGGLKAEFTPLSRAAVGTLVHVTATSRRPEGYQREVPVRFAFEWEGFRLVIRGRADGLYRADGNVIVEEIKSTYRPLERIDPQENAYHLAQLRLYHHFLARMHPEEPITPVLTYVHAVTLEEQTFRFDWLAADSAAFFEELAIAYLEKEQSLRHWRKARNASIRALRFPFPDQRPGQAELVEAVKRAAANHHDLLAEAATGIGKTLGILYPAIRQLAGRHGYSRIFFLTAKSAGAEVVRSAVALLRAQGMHLRVLYLQAKERICPFNAEERPECGEGYCPYADNFYSRAERLLPELLLEEDVTPERIRAVAEREVICPFELSLELSLCVDLIVCDYNYVFDPGAMLRRFFMSGLPNTHLFLVDEAHNLVPRGREMYSATLTEGTVKEIRELVSYDSARLASSLANLQSSFARWRGDLEDEGATALQLPALPPEVITAVEAALEHAADLLMVMPHGDRRKKLLDFYFDLVHFNRIAEGLTEEYAIYITGTRRQLLLRLFCLHPGPLLRHCVEHSVATVFFSGTLSPRAYFADLLGAREGYAHLSLPCPFPLENRLYLHVPAVSTKYTKREDSKLTVARVLLEVVRAQPGNYLAFFPSYAYLGTVWAEVMAGRPADMQVHAQQPGMSLAQQADFLAKVAHTGGDTSNLGLAVMGGLFGEAVDLPGDRLIGAIVIGPGLPGISPEQELIREYFDETHHGEGFHYAYIVPGMVRVIQAAGRVFRTPEDRGVVVLIDDRFLEEGYRELLPPDWCAADPDFSTQDFRAALDLFWGNA